MRLLIVIAAAGLVACTDPTSNTTNGQIAATADLPIRAEEPNMSQPVDNGAVPRLDTPGEQGNLTLRRDQADQCGAGEYQYLVGQPRSRIPEKPAGATWRVTCTGCPVTMDYNSSRLNIFYDEQSQIVEEVRCD